MSNPLGTKVCEDVLDELARARRLQKAGKFPKTIGMCNDFEALAVLVEEVGEVSHEVNETIGRTPDPEYLKRLRTELIQVAAMAVGWALRIDYPEYDGGVREPTPEDRQDTREPPYTRCYNFSRSFR